MSRGRMDWTAQTASGDSEIINELIARATQGSTAQTAPRDSEIIKALMSPVTHGLDTPNSPNGLRNHQRTDIMCYARIGHPKQPQVTQK